jgi:hypothetical protein
MTRGKHAAESQGSFYRDLVMMIVGILLVGAAVFLILYFVNSDPDPVAGDTTGVTESTSTTTSTLVTSTTLSGTTSTSTAPPTTTLPVRPPQEVRVVVLNSVGLAGAAGRKTQELADSGYQTQQAGDMEPEQNPSRIWYRAGFAPEANELLEFLPGATVEPLPDSELEPGADVVLVLGTGYTE